MIAFTKFLQLVFLFQITMILYQFSEVTSAPTATGLRATRSTRAFYNTRKYCEFLLTLPDVKPYFYRSHCRSISGMKRSTLEAGSFRRKTEELKGEEKKFVRKLVRLLRHLKDKEISKQ